jgi:spermidine/putrescine transport system substrate-binding protein
MPALKALGYSMNTPDPEQLNQAAELLLKQQTHVSSYSTLLIDENSQLLDGSAIAGITYNGDALAIQEQNESVAYVVPAEGSAIWVDFLAVAADSNNRKLAYQFIDFISRPENAARNANYLYYPSPITRASEYLDAEFLFNTQIYPSKPVLDQCEHYSELSPDGWRLRNQIYSTIIKGR